MRLERKRVHMLMAYVEALKDKPPEDEDDGK